MILYILFLYFVFAVIDFLPIVTILAAIISLFRKGMIKRKVLVIAVVPLIKVLKNINRHGLGPTEGEFFWRELQRGSVWAFLAFLGYLYLIYWWTTFLKDLAKQGNETTRRLIKVGLTSEFISIVIYFLVGFS